MTTRIPPTCTWVRDRIEGFVEGDLGDAERTAVARHASACSECEREISLSRSIRAELRAMPVFAVPPAVVERAQAAVARAPSERAGARAGWRTLAGGRFGAARWAMIGAAVAAAAWLAWLVPARAPHAPERIGADPAAIEALRDLNLAFAYVDRYAVRAADLVQDRVEGSMARAIRSPRIDAIEKDVAPWLRRALQESGSMAPRSPEDPS